MAIITHNTSKNANYSDVLTYYSFIHKEDPQTGHYEPVLDEYGLLQERTCFAVACLDPYGRDSDPEQWAAACLRTNLAFRKNLTPNARKSHEYIISHPAEDRPKMSMEDLLNEGKAFVRENLRGYDALIAVHRDTDNDHIHISINSVRAVEREAQPWMMVQEDGSPLLCETKAGGKHQDSPGFRAHYNDWLLEYCKEHGLEEKDNNAIARQRKEERQRSASEQTKGRRAVNKTKELKSALLALAPQCGDLEELRRRLKKEYGISLVRRGHTISLLHPESQKAVRLRTFGLTTEDLFKMMKSGRSLEEKQQRRDEDAKYIQWLRKRRLINGENAERIISDAERLAAERLDGLEDLHQKGDFQQFQFLLRKAVYIERDLQTEADKLDRLLDRWRLYVKKQGDEKQWQAHERYVRWCGCDPDSRLELDGLEAERKALASQQKYVQSIREALSSTGTLWGEKDADWVYRNLNWTIVRENSLREQRAAVQKNLRRLRQMAKNCDKSLQKSVLREYKQEMEAKRARLWAAYETNLAEAQRIQRQIKAQKQMKREAKRRVKSAEHSHEYHV